MARNTLAGKSKGKSKSAKHYAANKKKSITLLLHVKSIGQSLMQKTEKLERMVIKMVKICRTLKKVRW